jgi:hypothetical protein
MFALKLDVRACTRLLSVAAAARRSPLLLPGARLLQFKFLNFIVLSNANCF